MAKIMDRHFGCEIEISTPFQEAGEAFESIINLIYGPKSLLIKNSYFDSINNYKKWHLKTEITTEAELCTPISTFKTIKKIQDVSKMASSAKIEISTNDSLHVHVQANDVDPRNVLAAWLLYERTIKDCFPAYRRKNDYSSQLIKCKTQKKNIANFLMGAITDSQEHHCIISFNHYEERKTIEFRISEGTLDPDHIRNWVKFCLIFVDAAKKIDPVITLCKEVNDSNINDLISELKINDKKLQEWLKDRYKKFKKKILT